MASLTTYLTAGAGTQVGEVVQVTYNSYINNSAHVRPTGTGLTSTGATGTITPTKATNNLLIECNTDMSYGYASHPLVVTLYRSGDDVTDGHIQADLGSYTNQYYHGWSYIAGDDWGSNTFFWIDDDHNSTSQLTYTLYHRRWSGSSNSYTAHQGHPISFKIMEIETEV